MYSLALSTPNRITALFFVITLTAIPFSASVAEEGVSLKEARFHRSLSTAPAQGVIKIDGDLHDAGWATAARADSFVETSPGDQVEPAVKSAVLITYDQSNLYVAFIAYDDPKTIRAALRERDAIFSDDYFGIMLGTYEDLPWIYEIFVNPFGIQGDLRMTAEGNEDQSLDIVFYSEGKITDSGYQVEIAIPFSSLRFPNTEEQHWRVQFWRDQQRDIRRRFAWTAQERGNPCWVCHFGYLNGIKGIKPSSNLDILPSILSFQSGSLADVDDPHSAFENRKIDGEASLNVRYGITSNSSAEFTINPDFSQIESDEAQVDVNSTFGLYYSERRPFFMEGSELFDTWVSGVYTRTINNPIVAGKLTGQFGRWNLAYLTSYDENSPLTIPLFEQSEQGLLGKSFSNILRAKRSFGADSHVGLLLTTRQLQDTKATEETIESTGGAGTTFGIDAKLRLTKSWHIEWQTLGSYTQEAVAPDFVDTTVSDGIAQATFDHGSHTVALDGEHFWGEGTYLSLERHGRIWTLDFDYEDYMPTFRADNGFVTQAGYRATSLWTGWTFRQSGGFVLQVEPSVSLGRIWNHEAQFTLSDHHTGVKDEWVRPGLFFEFPGQTTFYSEVLFSCERFGIDREFFTYIRRGYFEFNTHPTKMFALGGWINIGTGIYRDRLDPELGDQTNAGGEVSVRFSQRFVITPGIQFAKLDHRQGYLDEHPDEGKNVYKGYILRSHITYQFSREASLRIVAQYNDFSERFDLEPLFTYRINPFTVFYIGMNSKFNQYHSGTYNEGLATEYKLDDPKTQLSQRQFFAKFQYLIRM